MKSDRTLLDENIRRTVAISALRKIRALVEEAEQDRRLERRAILIGIIIFALFLAGTAFLAINAYVNKPAKPSSAALEYVVALARAVEHYVTANPPAERYRQLTGTGALTISIKADGAVEDVRILVSSGQQDLDDVVRQLIRSAAPFEPFSPEMKRDIDILTVQHSFKFTNGLLQLPGIGEAHRR